MASILTPTATATRTATAGAHNDDDCAAGGGHSVAECLFNGGNYGIYVMLEDGLVEIVEKAK